MRRRVAVVGAGVSGLVGCHILHRAGLDVVLYEKEPQLGGHADTRRVFGIDVDVGFMICNEATYPNLMILFEQLGLTLRPADMSFSVSCGSGLEWATRSISAVFAQPSNAMSRDFWRMLADIKRFERDVEAYVTSASDMSETLSSFLARHKYSESFALNYLLPMCASIWSANPKSVLDFPALFLLKFMKNHSLLSTGSQRPQWLTILERSKAYVERLSAPFKDKTLLGVSIEKVELLNPASPSDYAVRLSDSRGQIADFHDVLFATHAPDTVKILGGAAPPYLRDLLSRFGYQNSTLYLHSDPSLMPRNKNCWASWNFLGAAATAEGGGQGGVYCSYYLNLLQDIKNVNEPILVTLNPPRPPAQHLVHQVWRTGHPVPTVESVSALPLLAAEQGKHGLWFAGAWLGWGFHECGAKSALEIAHRIIGTTWQPPPYTMPFYCNWTQWAAKRIALRQLSNVLQKGEIEMWERAGQIFPVGKSDAATTDRIQLVIESPQFYAHVCSRGVLAGFVSAWLEGLVTTTKDNLPALLCILFSNIASSGSGRRWSVLPTLYCSWKAWYDPEKKEASSAPNLDNYIRRDLAPAFYATFLGPTMSSSSGVFEASDSLLDAAHARQAEGLTTKLGIEARHRVLDLSSSGWGSLAIELARTVRCRVTSLVQSDEHKSFSEQRAEKTGVAEFVDFMLVSDLQKILADGAKYDRVISCELLFDGSSSLEHFQTLEKLLSKDGVACIQIMASTTAECQSKIFPSVTIPRSTTFTATIQNTRLSIRQVSDLSSHALHTLAVWRRSLVANRSTLAALGFDASNQRAWQLYIGEREAHLRLQTAQLTCIVLTRQDEQPSSAAGVAQ